MYIYIYYIDIIYIYTYRYILIYFHIHPSHTVGSSVVDLVHPHQTLRNLVTLPLRADHGAQCCLVLSLTKMSSRICMIPLGRYMRCFDQHKIAHVCPFQILVASCNVLSRKFKESSRLQCYGAGGCKYCGYPGVPKGAFGPGSKKSKANCSQLAEFLFLERDAIRRILTCENKIIRRERERERGMNRCSYQL